MTKKSGEGVTSVEDLLHGGFNLSQMEVLFGMDSRTITARIYGVPHHSVRNGAKCWLVRDVVHRLYKPSAAQVEAILPRMNTNALPKELSKEFWNGLRSRGAYMREMGDLWPTGKVVEVVSRLFKLLKQRIGQRVDGIERNMELSDALRTLLRESDAALLEELQHAIKEEFKERADDVEDSKENYILKMYQERSFDALAEPALPDVIEVDDDDEI